ncbi:hypothetical protein DNTS_004437 [Danionella cerebrum]|uniref:non-specific serine/threonine protein kinase n=1 Tax=Danionella cerebrum TaxID=2873325 RepID=A0A553R7B5_9TELE|nr:hypothetical protein DNTS_004437 [Danionella translucida]
MLHVSATHSATQQKSLLLERHVFHTALCLCFPVLLKLGHGEARVLTHVLLNCFRGKFAVVRKCVERSSGRTFAAKYLRKRRKGQDCRSDILHEICVLELAASCPRVIDLHEVYETSNEMSSIFWRCGVTELCEPEREASARELQTERVLATHLFPGAGDILGHWGRLQERRLGEGGGVRLAVFQLNVASLTQSSSWEFILSQHSTGEHVGIRRETYSMFLFAAGGEIFSQCVADRDEAFSELEVKRLMRQILEGISFLHQNNVVHLDIKPQNILLTSCSPLGDIKIVDFGLSRWVRGGQEIREIMGTPEYVAPEVLNYEPISSATDMWSIGVLAYVMLTGISPFLGNSKQETFLNISQIDISYSEEELETLEVSAVPFIQTLLVKEPEARASAESALQHPWLQLELVLKLPDPLSACQKSHDEDQGLLRAEGHDEDVSRDCDETRESHEELLVRAAFTMGQCRQALEVPGLSPEKSQSKRFRFHETLHGDCIC